MRKSLHIMSETYFLIPEVFTNSILNAKFLSRRFQSILKLGFNLFLFALIFQSIHAQDIPKIGRNQQLEIANWNLEWFGKTESGYGPDDDVQQQLLIWKCIMYSDLDIWGLCEISEKKAYDSLMSKLPLYDGVLSNYQPEQKTALLFKKSMFEFAGLKLLGQESKDSFSTGRFPIEVCLIPKTDIGIDSLFIIVLHLKANTGNDSLKYLAYRVGKNLLNGLKCISIRHIPTMHVL